MSSMRDDVLARQREDYSANRLVVPAELPRRPLFRTARIAVMLAVLTAFGVKAEKVSANQVSPKDPAGQTEQTYDLDADAFLDLNSEIMLDLMSLNPEQSKELKQKLEKDLVNETPDTMDGLANWIVKAKKFELLGGKVEGDIKVKGSALIQDISRASIKQTKKEYKAGKHMDALAAYFHQARQFYSIYAVAPKIFRSSLLREFHRIEDTINRIPASVLIKVLSEDRKHRNATRKPVSISASWVDSILKSRPLGKMASFLASAFSADMPHYWRPLASRIKHNGSFLVRGGNYYFRQGRGPGKMWKVKLHKHTSFYGASGYVSLEKANDPKEHRNVSLDQFYTLLDNNELSAFLDQVHREYQSQESFRNKRKLDRVDFPKKGKIVVIRIYPENPDPTVHKTLPQGMLVGRALEERYGERIRRDQICFSSDPVKALKERIRLFKEYYKDEEGGVHFYIDLNGHGYNGDMEEHKGVHISGPIKAEPIIRTIKEEAKDSFAYLGTIACFGGAFIPELKELYRKHPELSIGVVVSTQAKATEFNYIVCGAQLDAADELWLSEFGEEFILQLLKKNGIGRATRKADAEARKNNGCDADTMVGRDHIGDLGEIIDINANPFAEKVTAA